jgi:hypothetical protein
MFINSIQMTLNKNQREARKVLQNYFTGILYSNQQNFESLTKLLSINPYLNERNTFNNMNFSDEINEIINKACYLIWNSLIIDFSNLNPSINATINTNLIWNQYFRFYMKGTKTFIKTLENYKAKNKYDNEKIKFDYDKKYNNAYEEKSSEYFDSYDEKELQYIDKPEDFTKIISQELIRKSVDSDFDFTFCSNPDDIKNFHLVYGQFIQRSLEIAQQYLRENLLNKRCLQRYVELCNLPDNQKKLKESIKKYMHYFGSKDRKTMKYIVEQIEKNNFLLFDIDDIELSNCDQENLFRTVTEIDEFYLFRVVLKMKCSGLNITFPFFAELIDISYSIKEDIGRKLWKNSTLNNMIYPVNLIDTFNNFGYPIANLNYLIDDTIFILQEQDPNKPEKRCEKLLNFIRLNCIEQSLPSLPNEIVIFQKIYDLLLKEECSKFLFQDLFKYKDQKDDWITFEINSKFQSLDTFEKWCIEQNLLFENKVECFNKTKNELILVCLRYINNLIDKINDFCNFAKHSQNLTEYQKNFIHIQKNNFVSPSIRSYHQKYINNLLLLTRKKQLCEWYIELKFIDEIISYWTDFEQISLSKFNIFLINDQRVINDQLLQVIEIILNFFTSGKNSKPISIQTLIEPISSKNSFADFIGKFKLNNIM